ncbi:DedA family protein [Sneathiella sp. P13V-1]|uniref:DedA family protein n=1 Tax=Sneathiella sp. P13V-1 TaxID=2697366 RepID=UPI001D0F7B55|nr:DedA family protein [Sneathiella sp. P13V-1]
MDVIENIIRDYGVGIYLIIFGYCFLKSGLLPLLAGYGAQLGWLDTPSVISAVILGGYLGDELRFYLSRKYGLSLVNNRPRIKSMFLRAQSMFEKYGALYILLYRYPKGMRTIGALPIGITDIAWAHFTVLNALSTLIWACLLVGGGYLFGAKLETYLLEIWQELAVIMFIAFVIWIVVLWRRTTIPENTSNKLFSQRPK